jgi:hypothetical protein
MSSLNLYLSVCVRTDLTPKYKVKLSLYRPWRPLGLREFEAPTFPDIRLIDSGKVVSPTRRPLFTTGKLLILISARSLSTPGP